MTRCSNCHRIRHHGIYDGFATGKCTQVMGPICREVAEAYARGFKEAAGSVIPSRQVVDTIRSRFATYPRWEADGQVGHDAACAAKNVLEVDAYLDNATRYRNPENSE